MKRILYTLIILSLSIGSSVTAQVSASLVYNFSTEGDLRATESSIVVTVVDDTLQSDITTNLAKATEFYNGMTGGSSVWNAMISSLDETDITLENEGTKATITIPAESGYYIVENDTIAFTIPQQSLESNVADIIVDDSIVVSNQVTDVSDGGDCETSIAESSFRSGGRSYTITLTNNLWKTDISSTPGLRTDLRGMFATDGSYFSDLVTDIGEDDISVSGDAKVLSITFDRDAGFYIPVDEVITVTVHTDLLQFVETPSSTVGFTVTNENPTIAITPKTISENEIRAGNESFDITLIGDVWASSLSADFEDGIQGGVNWNTDLQDNLTFSRTNQQVTVTIPRTTTFNVDSDETIALKIAKGDLQFTNGADSIDVSGEITISAAPVSVSASATFDGDDEGDLRSGTKEIEILLIEDTWVSEIGTNNDINVDLINALSFSGQAEATSALRSAILGADKGEANTVVTGATVTITVPAIPDFDISANTDISVDVPVNATTNYTGILSDDNFASITRLTAGLTIASDPASPMSESQLHGATLEVTLSEDKFEASLSPSNFTFSWSGSGSGLSIASVGDINRISDTYAELDLSFSGDIDVDEDFTLTINAADLLGSVNLTSSNSIDVNGIVEPEIISVSIPNTGMGIGEIVTATITVINDNNQTFDFEGGTIAGRTLSSFGRSNSTTYTLDFAIGVEGSSPEYAAGDDIPVTNLEFSNQGSAGNVYSGVISGPADADEIDTQRPAVSLISYNGGTYKAGDVITAIVNAGEEDLSFDATNTIVNGYSLSDANVSVEAAGAGVYYLRYEVLPGDPEVVGTLLTSVRVVDVVGNESAVFSTVSGTAPVIDAAVPTITSMDEISWGEMIPGETVQIRITASEAGLELQSGSKVNNVALDPSALTDHGNSTYTLNYVIGENDAEVALGALSATVVLEDVAGNRVSSSTVINRDVAIFTEKPVAVIYGTSSICEGDSTIIYISCSDAQANYSVTVNADPGVSKTYPSIGSSHEIIVKPIENTEYTITLVSDRLGIVGYNSGSANVTVNSIPSPLIVKPMETKFPLGGDTEELEGSPSGGVFTGEGVVTSENLFYPEVADTGEHVITYTYEHPTTGCVGEVDMTIEVLEDQASLEIRGSTNDNQVICFNEGDVIIEGDNLSDTTPGTFYCFYYEESRYIYEVDGFFDPNTADNEAYLVPELMPIGRYRLYYQYLFQGYTYQTIYKEFVVKSVEDVKFIKYPEENICSNDPKLDLKASLDDPNEDYSFSGPGVTGSAATGFEFYPSNANIGGNYIVYDYASAEGCHVSDSVYTFVYDVPTVDFTFDTTCIPLDGGEVILSNETDKTALVQSWSWNFGDINSGAKNINVSSSFIPEVVHDFTSPDEFRVSLSIVTALGSCAAEKVIDLELADIPVVDFRWKSDCYLEGIPVKFVNESDTEGEFEPFLWSFYDEGMNLLDTIRTAAKENIEYLFTSQDIFNVQLEAKNKSNCQSDLNQLLVLKPTNTFRDTVIDFFTDFNSDDARWSPMMDNVNSEVNSWTYGEPDFTDFSALNGDLAWYTDLNKDLKERTERSWIQSPCFDFRNAVRPMIRMDVMKSFDFNRDGAVLQCSFNNGEEWHTIGNIGEGINWYNSFEIREKPGGGDPEDGSQIGWSGQGTFSPDTNWVSVAHDLDLLKDSANVVFGIFYATDGNAVVDNQGFAVDNLYIGERTRRALVEHFTDAGESGAYEADTTLNSFVQSDSLDVVSLQYHMHYSGQDAMNRNNPNPSSTRGFYYGVSAVPYAVMDGGIMTDYQYDFSSTVPTQAHLKQITLERPTFDLGMECTTNADTNHFEVDVEVKAMQDIEKRTLVLYVAVVESEVSSFAGADDLPFQNVVLDLLPNSAGEVIESAWSEGDILQRSYSWTSANVEDKKDVMLVAFIQDRDNNKVYQVAAVSADGITVGMSAPELEELTVYPNPVRDLLHIDYPLEHASVIAEIVDLSGRLLRVEQLYTGVSKHGIDVSGLLPGQYILMLRSDEAPLARTKFIKLR